MTVLLYCHLLWLCCGMECGGVVRCALLWCGMEWCCVVCSALVWCDVGIETNDISEIFKAAINQYSEIEIGAHFHTQPEKAFSKIKAAHEAGCNRFDGAIKGFGGCPMAADNLTGNMPSEKLISYFNQQKIRLNIDPIKFEYAYNQSLTIFI